MFVLSNIGSSATEGSGFSFDVTPESALSVDKRIRWEIIFRGDIPAFPSDFISMSGDLDFVSGATASQTITLSIADDNSYEVDREFVIRVWDTNNTADDISDDTRIGEDAVVILQDDDTNNFTNSVNAFTGLGDNTFTAASSIFLNFVSANGDDSFIITRFQYGDVRINDIAGSSYIKFDRGVTIEAINEEVVSFGGREVTSVDLILSTGSTITIEAPTKPEFQYQLGDSRVLDYGDFISTLGTVSASLPYVVTGSSTVATPDDGFRNVIGLYRTVGDDIMGLGSDFDLNVTGGLGDDSFIITRFQTGDVRIKDVAGSSYIKFDRGVTIVSVYEEVVSFGGREVTSVDLILSTGPTISIDAPTKLAFQYQFGDGVLLNYEDFASALSSVVVSVAGDVSSDRYVVGGVIFGAGPYHYSVSENLDASGVGNAMVLGSISATVTSGETLNYAFDGGTLTDSLGHFAIMSVGEISYIGSGLDRETTSVHYLKVQATSSDGSVDVANISIEVDNVNEAPVLLSMIGSQTVTIAVDLDVSSFFGDGDVASSGDELIYTAMRVDSGGVNPTALPSGLSINADTGIFSASSSVVGVTYQVEVTATDSGGLSVVSNVFALYVNTAPVVSNSIDDETITLGDSHVITIADSNNAASNVFSDVDGDALTYTATFSDGSSLSGGITFVTSNGVTQLIFDSSVVAGVYDFSITTTDIHGASGVESFRVTVNTSPQFSSSDAITNNNSTVTEDATNNSVTGVLSFDDDDSGDTLASLSLHATNDGTAPTASNGLLTFTSGDVSIGGTYGTFTFMRDATTSAVTWTYDLDNADSDTNVLGSGVSVTESVQLLVRDDDNAVSSVETLTVNIEGSNDAPIVSNSIDNATITLADSHVVTIADSNNTASNVFSDVDTGDSLSYSATLSDGSSLPSGITFVTSNGVTQLSFGTTVVLGVYELAVTATDSQSLSVTETFTVTVSTNIAPAFSSADAITFTGNDSTVTEDDFTDNRVSGALSFNDVDSGDTLASLLLHATSDGTPPTVSIGLLTFALGEAFVVGVYGTFTFMRDATTSAVTWRYDLDNADSDTNALDVGATATDSVQLLVRDDENAVSSVETFSVSVVGSSDLMNPIELSIQGSASVTGVTLSGDVDTDLNVIVVKGNNTTVTSSVSDSRFALDANNNLIAQSGAVFDYTTEPIVSITIKIVVTDANGSVNVKTIDAIVNVVTATGPVFSLGTSSGTSISSATQSEWFNIDENIDIADLVYTASATADALATDALVYTLGGTDVALFNIGGSSGVVTFIASPDYESGKTRYSFSVIATTSLPTPMSGIRKIELFIQDVNEAPDIMVSGTAIAIDEATLEADSDTGFVVSASDQDGDTYTYTVSDSRFKIVQDNSSGTVVNTLTAKDGAVFDYEAGSRVNVVITATNTTDSNDTYNTAPITISITNVYDAPVFSTGMSSGTIAHNITNLALNTVTTTTVDTSDITDWYTDGSLNTAAKHIANINDGDTNAVEYGFAVHPQLAAGKHISFALGGDYVEGKFIYHNRNDGSVGDGRVNGSTVEFIKDGVTVHSAIINAGSGYIETITASVDTVFDTARIVFFGSDQNFREIEVFGRLEDSFNIDENIDTADVVYTASATADALATSSVVVYTLGGTDAALFNIDTSSGVVTFKVSPDYETQDRYSFSVIATTNQPTTVSATRSVELFIQDVNDAPDITVSGTQNAISEGTLTADRDTGFVVSASDQDGDTYSFTVDDSRFYLRVSDNHLIAQSGAVFDYDTEPSVDVVITATNTTDSNETYQESTTISITNVYDAPVFSTGTSSGTLLSVINLALNVTPTTDITSWFTLGDVDTPEEHIANINDGDTNAVRYGTAVFPRSANDKYISFALGGDYVQGSFIYHNRNDGYEYGVDRVNGSTVAFIKDGVTVYSEVIANAEDNTDDIVTITAPVGTVFDTARITFSGDYQYFREIEVLGHLEGSEWFDIDENIDITTYVVYRASVTVDASASSVAYTLGGTDASSFSISSTGEVTFIASPDYETQDRYSFSVIATTSLPTPVSATRPVELFIQDVYEAPTINLTDPDSTFSITEGTALTADSDTGSVFSFSDPEGDIYTYTLDDSRFKLVQDNSSGTVVYNLTAKDGAVFDYETEPSVIVVITATNTTDSNEVYTRSTTISITNVYDAPVFSTGTSSSGTIASIPNLALNVTPTTNITSWVTFGDVDTPAEHIANINDGDLIGGIYGFSVHPQSADGKEISFALGGDYVQGSFIYHNRNDGTSGDGVNGSTVDFIKNGTTVYSKEIAYAGNIVTITAPVDTVFDTVHIVFSGESQNFREIEVFGHLVGSDSFNIDENIDTADVVYDASATADILATSPVVAYSLGGTDASDFNIDTSTGVVTFKVSPDYETQSEYSFSVIATTDQPSTVSGTRKIELFIQDVNDAPTTTLTASTVTITEGTLTADKDTGSVFSFSDPEGDTFSLTINDGRFKLDANNHLIAQSGAVFDYEAGSRVNVVITATNTTDSNDRYDTDPITVLSLTNVYDAPYFSTGTSSSGTIPSIPNLVLDVVIDTDIASWLTLGDVDTPEEHIANINDGDTNAVQYGSAVGPTDANDKYISFALGGDYVQGSFIYHNRNDGIRENRVNGSTVEFIEDGTTVYSEVIANAEDNTDDIVTITAPVGTVFDTARIVFLGGYYQNFREIEVFGRLVGSDSFNIDENIATTVSVYDASATADALATTGSVVVYTLGGTDASDFNIDTSTGVVTFIASPDYETKLRYSFSVIATTDQPSTVSATRPVELFIQDVNDAPVVANIIADQSLDEGTGLNFTLPSNVFSDADTGDTLTYTVADTAGSSLPNWISFNASTGNFSGTAPSVPSDTTISIRVTATDDSSASIYDDFDIIIMDVI